MNPDLRNFWPGSNHLWINEFIPEVKTPKQWNSFRSLHYSCHVGGCNWEDEYDFSLSLCRIPHARRPEKCQELYLASFPFSSYVVSEKGNFSSFLSFMVHKIFHLSHSFGCLHRLFTKVCLCTTYLFSVAEFWFCFIGQMLLNLEFFSHWKVLKCLQCYSIKKKSLLLFFNIF